MLIIVAGILAALWLVGLIGRIGGGLIHMLLVFALVLFMFNVLTGRRSNA